MVFATLLQQDGQKAGGSMLTSALSLVLHETKRIFCQKLSPKTHCHNLCFEKYIDWMRNLKIDTHGDLDIKPTSDKANVPKFSVNVADLYL